LTGSGTLDPAGSSRFAGVGAAGDAAAGSDRRWSAAAFAVTVALVGLLAADQGGYFPGAWALATPALAMVVIVVLALAEEVVLSRAAIAMVGGLAALCAWTAASALWSGDSTATAQDVRRTLLYVAGTAALLLLARAGGGVPVALGVLAAATAVDTYSIASRLYPRTFGMFDTGVGFGRLYQPIGYWNGLGAFTAVAVLLALGFAARGRMAVRMLAAGALVVLAPTLYLTFSRGALVALAAGLLVLIALDRRRVQLAVAGGAGSVGAIAAIVAVHGHPALTTYYRHLAPQTTQGAVVAATLLVLVPVAMGAAALVYGLESRVALPPRAHTLAGTAMVVVVLAAAGFGIHRLGSPVGAVHDALATLRKPAPTFPKGDLNHRLFSLSTNGRVLFWKAAWHDFLAHPVIGSGGGTYARYWIEHRPVHIHVRNAHSVFLETMAELGVVGLVLIVAALAAPLWDGLRVLGHGLAAALVAAYAAFLVQVAADWTWQLPAVILAALACGAAMTGLAPAPGGIRVSERARVGGIVLAGLVAVGAIVGVHR
jgi:O-Antigen ligase